jgi:hypothetical protein
MTPAIESAGVICGLSGRGFSSWVSSGAVPFVADGREAVGDLETDVATVDVELEVVLRYVELLIDDEGAGVGRGVDVGVTELPSFDSAEVF